MFLLLLALLLGLVFLPMPGTIDGSLHFPRAVGGVDTALPLAVYYVLFFLFLTVFLTRRSLCESPTLPHSFSAQPGAT